MLVVILEKASKKLHGCLSQLLVKVSPRIYIGAYSIKVRENILSLLAQKSEIAVVAWDALTEAGFKVKNFGATKQSLIELDGLQLFQKR